MAKTKLYNYKTVDKFIANAEKRGYEVLQVSEGTLGSGDWLLLSPDEHPDYVIIEVALNSWSSAHRIISRDSLSQKDAWDIAVRFAHEAEGYRTRLEELTGKKPETSTDPLIAEALKKGYHVIKVDADGNSIGDWLLLSPDTRPSFSIMEDFSGERRERKVFSKQSADLWPLLERFACDAVDIWWDLEDVG